MAGRPSTGTARECVVHSRRTAHVVGVRTHQRGAVADSAGAAPSAGDLVRAARRFADLSQRELAQKAGVPVSAVSRIESGETGSPGIRTLLTLLAAAGCHLELRPGAASGDLTSPLTDRAGRRYPAHLDVRPVDRFGSWWGDWPMLSTRAERIWHHAPRQRPEHTFDLARWRRDARRAAPPDDGGDYARPHPAAE